MARTWGTVRTTEGPMSVGPQAVHIDRTPRSYLSGLLAVVSSGDVLRRAWAGFRFLYVFVLPIVTFYQLARLLEWSHAFAVGTALLWVGFTLVPVVQRYREQSIARSAITEVSLETDDRRLTLTHEADSRLSTLVAGLSGRDTSSFFSTRRTTTLSLPTEDDVRDARATLRTAGIVEDVDDLEATNEPETSREYRVETRRGVVFCADCGSQVSPADEHCSSCSRPLRVERPEQPERSTRRSARWS